MVCVQNFLRITMLVALYRVFLWFYGKKGISGEVTCAQSWKPGSTTWPRSCCPRGGLSRGAHATWHGWGRGRGAELLCPAQCRRLGSQLGGLEGDLGETLQMDTCLSAWSPERKTH